MEEALFSKSEPHPQGYREIDPPAVAAQRGQARLIDVREPNEFHGELGHAPSAELVPLATLGERAAEWNREAPIVLICRSGARSGRAAAQLIGMGFRRVINMRGGMLAWKEAGLAVAGS